MLAAELAESELAELAKEEGARLEQQEKRLRTRFTSASFPPIRPIRATPYRKSGPAPVVRNRPCSPPTCSACTRATPKHAAGNKENLNSSPSDLGGYKEIIFEITGTDVYNGLGLRERRSSRPTCPGDGSPRSTIPAPAPSPCCSRTGSRRRNQTGRFGYHPLSSFRSRRPGRQHDRFGGANYPQTFRPHRALRRSTLAAEEQARTRLNRPAFAPARNAKWPRKTPNTPPNARPCSRHRERNERIRTYNFPQNRVTDHRIELTLYNPPSSWKEISTRFSNRSSRMTPKNASPN